MQFDPETIERVAQAAIYETNNEAKRTAENQFEQFLFNVPLHSLFELFETFSTTVVLAAAAILARHVGKIPNLAEYMDKINEILRSWFNPNDGKFIRKNGKELEKYTVNTVGLFIGRSLKELFQIKGSEKKVLDWLKLPQQGDKYRLYLFLVFIENVSLIDGNLKFVSYKILLQSFQEEVIPVMLACLLPYFTNFSQDVELSGLNVMHGNMTIRDNQGQLQEMDYRDNKAFNAFSFSIFQLLQEIITFKYNINYRQFDSSDQGRNTISFPDSVITQILKKDFLDSLYTLINRLLQIRAEKYFSICLECLEKILAAKVIFIDKHLLGKFVAVNLKGIVELLDSFIDRSVGDTKSLNKVVDCCNMFLEVFGLCQIPDLQKLDDKQKQYLQRWIKRAYQLPTLIMSSGQTLNAENDLFLGSVEMMKSIGSEMSALGLNQGWNEVQEWYEQFVQYFFKSFFLTSTDILGQVTFRSVQELKKTSQQFFGNIVALCSPCYLSVFTNLKELLVNFYNQLESNQLNISNIFLFLSATIESQVFFQINLNHKYLFDGFQHEYKYQEQISALGNLFYTVFEFIKSYQENKSYCSTRINYSLAIFYESYLTRFVKEIHIKGLEDLQSLGFEVAIKDRLWGVLQKVFQTNDEAFILSGLIGMSRLIKNTDFACVQFVFTCLHSLILEIKHKFIKETFKETPIFKEMLALYNGLVTQKLSKDILKWRIILYKTVSVLCFDQNLDEYRGNIRIAIDLTKNNLNEGNYEQILYDLTGICDGIQKNSVFEYFLQKLTVEIPYSQLMQKLLENLGRQQTFLKEILHLNYLLIQKKDADNASVVVYHIIENSLSFWIHIWQKIGADQEKTQLFEELYLIQKTLISEGHINLAVVDSKAPVNLKNFVLLSINHLQYFYDYIENYPQLIKIYFSVVQLYFDDLKNLLFNHEDKQFPTTMLQLLYHIMSKLNTLFQNVINQSYNPIILEHTLKILQIFFDYASKSREYIHKNISKMQLYGILDINDDKLQFIATVFMLGMHFGNRQEMQTVKTITRIAYNCTMCYNFNLEAMADRIGVTNDSDRRQFARILNTIVEGKQAEWNVYQLQDWFKNQTRFQENSLSSASFDGY